METFILMIVANSTAGLETFLRGMETGWEEPRGGLPHVPLKPSLEGWKLGPIAEALNEAVP